MPRARLAEPSYKNGYAHSAGESANPALWPTYAWVPRLGHSGTEVHEVNRGASMSMDTMTPGAGWKLDQKSYNITCDGTVGDNLATVNTFAQDHYDGLTLVAAFKQTGWATLEGIFGRVGALDDGVFGLMNDNTTNELRFYIRGASGTSVVDTAGTGDALWFDGNWHTLAGVNRPDGTSSVYVDGILRGGEAADPGDMSAAVPMAWEIGRGIFDTQLNGSVGSCLFYDRALTQSEIRHLSDDIMAPFRLKSHPIPV